MDFGKDLLDILSIPNPKGQLKLSHFIHEEPNLGRRKQMEDFTLAIPDILNDGRFSFYAVMDGHGGFEVAELIKKETPLLLPEILKSYKGEMKTVIESLVDSLQEKIKVIGGEACGSTFCGIVVDSKTDKVFYFNVGDSNIGAVRYDSGGNIQSDFKCKPHKVSNPVEMNRIKREGGSVMNGRLAGNLLITRSLGDFDMKEHGLISKPDIKQSKLFKNKLLFVASDGIWDVMTQVELLQILKGKPRRSLEEVARAMVKFAVKWGSNDNLAIIVVLIQYSEEG